MRFVGYVVQTESGDEYVGITNDLARRFREHKAKGPLKGESLELLVTEVFSDRETAGKWEIEQIASRGGPEKLLNTSFGGHGGRRRNVTQAERDHLSRLATERQASQEFRDRMSEACKAAWANPELRKRHSKKSKNRCAKPEVKARRSKAQKETWRDPEVRARRIAGIKAYKNDPTKAEARTAAAHKMWQTRRQEEK